MNWEYVAQPFYNGLVGDDALTEVMIKVDEPYTMLSAKLKGDWSKRDKADVVNAVLEYNHKLLFVDRAMAESVIKIEEIDNKMKEVDKKIIEVDEVVAKANETITITRKAYSETIMSIADLEDKLYKLAEHNNFNLDEEESEEDVAIN